MQENENSLRVQLEEERQEMEIILAEHQKLKLDLDELMARERKLTKENTNLEKSLAMLKHDLKEVNFNSSYSHRESYK